MATHTEGRFKAGRAAAISTLAGLLSLALCGCGGSQSTSELIEMSKSKGSADRARAVQMLGERKAEAETVVPVLIQALKDEDAFVRRDAAKALGQIGPPAETAVPALRFAARDKNQHVRQTASVALHQIAPDLPPEPKKK